MVRAARWMVISVILALTAALIGGFLGALHPAGDSLSVFRLPFAGLLALVVIWSNWPAFLRWLIAVLCLGAMGQVVSLKYTSHAPGPVAVYQKNLRFENDQVDALRADIDEVQPDIITLQELTSRNAPLVQALRQTYPFQASCALTDWARVAVLSRWPVEGEICIEDRGLVGVQVTAPEGTFWALSLHAFWPWPFSQRAQFQDLLPVLSSLGDPVVLAGDFNMVPWSFSLRQIAAVTDASRAGPLLPTLLKMGAPLPIDHVFAPGGGSAELRPLLGSDHHGVLARVFVFE